jgi:hypothetical protein
MANVGNVQSTTTANGGNNPSASPIRGSVTKIALAWTSTAGGVVTFLLAAAVSGVLLAVEFIPDAVAAPTDLYDVTLTDEQGIDVLAGQGADLSTANKSIVCPGFVTLDGTTISWCPARRMR